MTKMWNWLIDFLPEKNLDFWSSFLAVAAIVLPMLGGLVGWVALDVTAKASAVKERVFSERIAAAEAAARPKPIREKLLAFISSLDPKILQNLKAGNTLFKGAFSQRKVHELETLCEEAGASAFITLTVNPRNNIMIDGASNPTEIEFILNQSILK